MPKPEASTAEVALLALILGNLTAFGQEVPRWEVGPSISMHKIVAGDSNSYFGFGGRGVLNFSRLFGAEVQFVHTSTSSTFAAQNSTTTEGDDQLTANLKTTWRPQNVRWVNPYGLFGLGMTRNSSRAVSVPPQSFDGSSHEELFALRLGGGAGIIPHRLIAIRLEVSDLLTQMPSSTSSVPFCHCDNPAYWTQRWDASVSLMVRFGAIRKAVK